MSKTHHVYSITRSTEPSSAWLVIHEVGDGETLTSVGTAWTTLAAARRHIATLRGQKRIRLDKLSDHAYRYVYSS